MHEQKLLLMQFLHDSPFCIEWDPRNFSRNYRRLTVFINLLELIIE